MNVLVIAPHHDDEVIGCGGSIVLHADRGDVVAVAYVTQGWSGIPTVQDRDTAIRQIRAEAFEAGQILGVAHTIECGATDRAITQNADRVTEELIRVCRQVQPVVIYIPHEHDGDQEHQLVHTLMRQVVWQAISSYFPAYGSPMPMPELILGYEVWRPMAAYQTSVDVSSVIDRKIQAIKCYCSQLENRDWASAIFGLSAFRGVTSGTGSHAEVFQVIRCHNALSRKV